MRGLRFALLLVCGLGVASPNRAAADTYLCKTPSGETISGPEPPRECADGPMRRIRPNGATEEIGPKLTPEQRRRQDQDEKRQHEEAERRKEQMRRDFALLEAYKSEAEIEAARNRDLAALQARIGIARKTLDSVERDGKRLELETEFYAKRELPATLKNAIETNEARRKTQQRVIDDSKSAMERINEHYDGLVGRYRELTNAQGPRPPAAKP